MTDTCMEKKTEKNGYPCTNCKREGTSHNPCPKFKEWFGEEWKKIRKTFGKDDN